jgi:hypothetical protein
MFEIAVMVEPRLHKYLKPVIDNMLRNINDDIPIQIFHSKVNEQFLRNNYGKLINNNKIILTLLENVINLTIREYNLLLTSNEFWNKINKEIILIFQTDSCVVRHMNTFDFTPYLDNGFIGAPCRLPPWQNGGFSIRKKSLMLKAIELSKIKITYNEDRFFSYDNKIICKPSSYELGNAFSVEQYYNENPFGLHKAWKYLSKENWQALKNKFPEIKLTFNDI